MPFRAGAHDAGINNSGNTDGTDRTDEKTDRIGARGERCFFGWQLKQLQGLLLSPRLPLPTQKKSYSIPVRSSLECTDSIVVDWFDSCSAQLAVTIPFAYSAFNPGGATVISRAPNRHASMYSGSLTAQKVSRTSGRCSRLTDSSPTAS